MASNPPSAQVPVRIQGSSLCVHHHGTELTLSCRKCSELACLLCKTTNHHGHILDNLSDVISSKKGNIQAFIDQTEQIDIVYLETEIETIAQKWEDNEMKFQIHQNEVENQGKKMKEEIDIIVNQSVSLCTELKRENEQRLNKYRGDIKTRIKELETLVQKCRDTLETESEVHIYDIEKKLGVLPAVELNLCNLNFTPNRQPKGYLNLSMGKLTTVGYQLMCNTKEPEDESSINPSVELREEKQIKAPYNVSSICANKDRGAWICSSEADSIFQLDQWMEERVCFKVCVSDISVSPKTGDVWASSEDNNSIMVLSTHGSPIKKFTTTSAPRCLCVTRESHIIVGMTRELVCCDVLGTSLKSKTICTPKKIAACPITGNIAVVEMDLRVHEGEGRPHILVLNESFQEYHRYFGNRKDNVTAPDSSASNAFLPIDVTFDSVGNLLVGDHGNNSILMLNTTGELVKTIYNDPWRIVALSINSKDSVWAVFRYRDYPNYKVKMLKPVY